MGIKIIIKNKRAFHDYTITDTYEAGVSLQGTEVKSIRDGKVKLAESFITIDESLEAWIHNMHIAHYAFGNIHNHNETRKRKLLLHKREIEKIKKQLSAQGQTVIPIKLYFKKGFIKIEIALGKGKKLYDKRASEAKRDVERKIRQGKYD